MSVGFGSRARQRKDRVKRSLGPSAAGATAKRAPGTRRASRSQARPNGVSWKLVGHHRKVTLTIAWL